MRKSGVLFGMLLCALLALPLSQATLTCSVKLSSCAGGEVEMLSMNGTNNAHAELPGRMGSTYLNKVCCSGMAGLTNANGGTILKLSAATNAHAEKSTGTTYNTHIARIGSNGPVGCSYQAACSGQYVCLASIEKDTNAHVGACSAYATKICCGCSDTTEVNCGDGVDNDCDGLTDCADSECDGAIQGEIRNAENVQLNGASVKALLGVAQMGSGTTSAAGMYSFTIHCGTYTLAVDHPDYTRVTRSNVIVPPRTTKIENFMGDDAIASATSCESDCTFPESNVIHSSCSGKNGCLFYDAIAEAACDNAQVGWMRDYDSTRKVSCPSGPLQIKDDQKASVACESEICTVASTPVIYNGQQAKMIVVVAGK